MLFRSIQRLYSILKGEPEFAEELEEESAFDGHGPALARGPQPVVYNERIPPEFFDVIVVDECHRSIYSLWSQVLEYFDASIIGLTATPGGHTYAWFQQNVVSEYRHEEAVRDKVNVPFWVYQIRTEGPGRCDARNQAPAVLGETLSLDCLPILPMCANEMYKPCKSLRAYPDSSCPHQCQMSFRAQLGVDECYR